ncbi:MAG: DEAD-box ATP-dependent RNA helicase DeaD (CshA), partial [uncultured Nocardioides sp.]
GRTICRRTDDLRRPRARTRGAEGARQRRLRDPDADPGADDPAAARGPPRRRPRPDRHRQDRGVRAADPLPPRPLPEGAAGAGPGPDARAGAAGLRGVREVRRPPQGRPRAADLRRPGVRRAALRAAPRRARGRRDPGPDHGPPGEGHPRPLPAALPRARRGRRDAEDGLRRGRRDDPRGDPGRQARRAVLRHDAGADPSHLQEVPRRPGRDHRQEQDDDLVQHHPALPRRVLPPEGRRPDADPRGGELRGDDRLRPHQERDRAARREAARPRVLGHGDQRRRAPAGARAHGQPAEVRQARHPRRHRRRRPRARRRADQPRHQLRHPHRHRVLRPPDRPDRPGRPHGRLHRVRDAARAPPAPRDREGDPSAADADADAVGRRHQLHPAHPLRRRHHRRAGRAGPDLLLPRRRLPLRRGARRPRGRRRGRPGRRHARRRAPPAGGEGRACRDLPGGASRSVRRRRWRAAAPGTQRRADGDVPPRRRQAAPRRAAPDRRRARQRGRPVARRLRLHLHQARLLARRAAGEPAEGDPGAPRRHPDLRAAHLDPAGLGPEPALRRLQGQEPPL